MTSKKPAHFVAIPLGAWGHLRPHLHLLLNLLRVHPELHLTLLIQPSSLASVEKELKSVALQHSQPASLSARADAPELAASAGAPAVDDRMQLIVVSSPGASNKAGFVPDDMVAEAMNFAKLLPDFLKGAFAGERKLGVGHMAENRFADVPVSFVMYDLFQSFVPDVVGDVRKELELGGLPLIGVFPTIAASIWNHFAPGSYVEIMETKVKAAIGQGISPLDAYAKYGFASYGDVVRVPGLPPKYDYEYMPMGGAMMMPPSVSQQVAGMYRAAWHPSTTALITTTTQELEEECHAAVERALGKPVLMAGMQFPERMWRGAKMPRSYASDEDKHVMGFLDDMQAKHGDKSVVYVSFGSIWYPALRPELVIYLLDSLIESGQPFIFAYATWLLPNQPDAVKERLAAYPDGCLIKFAPQWQILEHPATAFAVTHCGANTTAECMMNGLPIVAMPFGADQGELAEMYCGVYKAGVTLKQPYTFKEGNDRFHTLYDGTEILGTEDAIKAEMKATWALMRGPEGDTMRQRMAGLREKAKQSWQEGCSRRAMEAVAQYF